MDPEEDPSVTAAIVNVVCELGWRRPHDFLPLAPRLFELLVDGGNNWMAIKLIKLFATLTPLEPRLVRKLLPPLTTLIKTTPAMSLLYECINGIIQGGILGADDSGAEEIATLCVNKLRGMMVMDGGDANLKYVALLAFNKIVVTHPYLVSQQEDVILDCIDSPDITIRIQALDLVQGMVTEDNLLSVVSRLMKQLKSSTPSKDSNGSATPSVEGVDSDDEAQAIATQKKADRQAQVLPEDYRVDVIGRILYMCAKDNYANISDFDWYIDILTQLVRMAPVSRVVDPDLQPTAKVAVDVSEKIGDELRNVAVKVKAMRATVVRAAEIILAWLNADTPAGHPISSRALKSGCWILGEYAVHLGNPNDGLNSLLQLVPRTNLPEVTTSSLQAIAKIFSIIAGNQMESWTAQRKSEITLLMARIIHVLEPLTLHPNLEVQGRAVEFTELLKLTVEAAEGHAASTDQESQDPPLLLTQAIPSLFTGWELNSVAAKAQLNVPLPDDLNLDEPIHPDLNNLLSQADDITLDADSNDDFEVYYHQRPVPTSLSSSSAPAINRLAEGPEETSSSYQSATEDTYLDADIVARRKAERVERNRDDPFYIPSNSTPRASTPIHNILQDNNGSDLDVDSIPIMQLDLSAAPPAQTQRSRPQPRPRQKVTIAADETLEGSAPSSEPDADSFTRSQKAKRTKQGLLGVDSSHIGSFSLEGEPSNGFDHEAQQREDEEMKRAMKEVERLRLEMQRANERVEVPKGMDAEGTVVRRKKKKKVTATGEEGEVVKPKKKKAKPVEGAEDEAAPGPEGEAVKPKKKKKKRPVEQVEQLSEGPAVDS